MKEVDEKLGQHADYDRSAHDGDLAELHEDEYGTAEMDPNHEEYGHEEDPHPLPHHFEGGGPEQQAAEFPNLEEHTDDDIMP